MKSARQKLAFNLKALRNKNCLSQVELAKLLHIDKSYISNIESKKSNPTLTTLEKIAQALDVSIDKLLF